MNKLNSIVSNTIITLIGQVITTTSTMLLIVAYGRFLGDSKFGELYFATTFVVLVGFPLELGFNQQLTREVALEPDQANRYLSNTLLLKGALWIVFYSFILLICWLLNYGAEERVLVAICGVDLLISSIATSFGAANIAFGRVIFPVIGGILEKGLCAFVGIFLLERGVGVQGMAYLLLGGTLVNFLWQALWSRPLRQGGFVFDRVLIRKLLRTSIPFMMYGALTVIYYRLDTVLLSLMTNAAVVGWYGAGYRLFDTMTFLSNLVINVVMYPVFSKLSKTSEEKLKLAIEKSMNFLLFFGLPMSVGMMVTAPGIIALLYHRAEFRQTIPALQGLAPGLVFLYANTVFSNVIISTKHEKKITIMAAIALVFNLSLNLFLIPPFRHVGAAIVTSLTESLLFFLSLIFVPRGLLPVKSLRVAAKAALATGVMVVAIWLLGLAHIVNILLVLPIAMLVYFATSTLLCTIPGEDIRALYGSLRQKVRTSTPSLVTQTDRAIELLPVFVGGVQMADGGQREVDSSLPDTPLPRLSPSEIVIVSEDGSKPSDSCAQTEPRLKIPWWLRSPVSSENSASNKLAPGQRQREHPASEEQDPW